LRGRVAAPAVLEATANATAAPSARTTTTRPGEVCQLDSYARPVRISSLLGRCGISRCTEDELGEIARRARMGGVDETTSQRCPFARTRESLPIRLKSRGARTKVDTRGAGTPRSRSGDGAGASTPHRRQGSLTTERRPCAELHRGEIVVLRLSNQATIVQFAWFT